MPYVTTSDGTEIFYKDWGSGQPIVFHHGWPLSSDDWDAQMMFFLQHGYRVIAHDRRGHGRSTQTSDGHDMDTYAADAAARRRAPRPARRHPRRPLHRRRRGRPLRRPPRQRPRRQGGADRRGAAADAEDRRQPRRPPDRGVRRLPRRHRVQPRPVLPRRRRRTVLRLQPPGREVSEGVIRNWWRQGMMGGAKAHYEGIKAFSETDFTEDLKAIDVPTLVMHGDDDQVVPIADSRRAVDQAAQERHAEGLPGLPARHVHHPRRRHQRRPARLHRGLNARCDTEPARPGRAYLRPARAHRPDRRTGHDPGVAGGRRRPLGRPVLRLPPQRGYLVALCVDLPPPARVPQVGGDGGDRVAPRPPGSLPVPAGHRPHRLRGHPAQSRAAASAADRRTSTPSGRRTTPSSTTSSGCTSRTSRPTTGSNVCAPSSRQSPTTRPSSPASRRSTKAAASWRTRRRRRRPGGRPRISSGRATSSSSSTSSAPWCNRTSIACPAGSPGSSRSARPRASRCAEYGTRLAYFTSFYLHSLTRGVPHASESAVVAQDHPLRRPLALARDQRRTPLPEPRCRHPPDRRQPAADRRRSTRPTRRSPASSRARPGPPRHRGDSCENRSGPHSHCEGRFAGSGGRISTCDLWAMGDPTNTNRRAR